MKFDTRLNQLMNESLLEGNADYGDVMDALSKLKTKIDEFGHIYPADRGTHIHGAFKAEIERITSRVTDWINKQSSHVKHTAQDTTPPVVSLPSA